MVVCTIDEYDSTEMYRNSIKNGYRSKDFPSIRATCFIFDKFVEEESIFGTDTTIDLQEAKKEAEAGSLCRRSHCPKPISGPASGYYRTNPTRLQSLPDQEHLQLLAT